VSDESDCGNDVSQDFVGVGTLSSCTMLESILKHLDEKGVE